MNLDKVKLVEELFERLRQAYEKVLLDVADEHKELLQGLPNLAGSFRNEEHKKLVSLIPSFMRILRFVQEGPVQVVAETRNRGMGWAVQGAKKAAKALTMPKTEESEKRLEVCKGCDQWTGKSCKVCGCFVSLKVRIPEEKCPLGKW